MIPKSLLLRLLIPLGLVLTGTLGYRIIEGWSYFDALYMTVTTISTVGFSEMHGLSTAGRVFTIFLIFGGVFTMFYVASDLIRFVVGGELRDVWGRQHMESQLAELRRHVIVCGYGRVGRLVCREFSREKTPFVILDNREEALKDFAVPGGIPLVADATSDEALRHAGIERARGLVTVMANDSDNLFTTMSARLLNAELFIVARVEDAASEQKLLRAGANRVVSPYQIGGSRIAHALLRPTVVDFIDLATRTEHLDLQLEEARIGGRSSLAGRALRDSGLREDLKLIVVAIKKAGGKMIFNPEPDTLLEAGDILVAIGSQGQLARLETMTNPPAKT